MSLIEWSDQLSIGFPEVDQDHQKLVGILNNFHDAIEARSDREELVEILEDLISYTSWHFRHEERLMQQHGYEGFMEHKEIHQDLAGKAVAIQDKFEAGDDSVLDVLIPFLKEWLTEHILGTDKKMGMFLAANA